jgi:hypothetical protein
MMRDTTTILRKEWQCALASDRGMLVVQLVLVLLWSFIFAGTASPSPLALLPLWLLPFSVVVATNFAQSVFVAERVNGAVEVLLTCGLSRQAIVLGKFLFVWAASCVLGFACLGLSSIWVALGPELLGMHGPTVGAEGFLLFAAAAFFNAGLGAFLAIELPNPRMVHFVDFLAMAALLAAYYTVRTAVPVPSLLLTFCLLVLGAVSLALALLSSRGERIARPVNL